MIRFLSNGLAATALLVVLFMAVLILAAPGCGSRDRAAQDSNSITDQLGRKVVLPDRIDKIAALHHFGGKIVYALGEQHRLVERSIYGREARALVGIDPKFAALPNLIQAHGYNIEGLAALGPDITFTYASNDRSELELFENAGLPVVAVKGETFEESFAAVRLIAGILGVPEKGALYVRACRDMLDLVASRLARVKAAPKKVMFAGPKNIYSVATGQMLQTRILERSGADNVAKGLKGFWADVSPEQIALWNPEVIFLGSSLDSYDREKLFENPHFATVTAIREKKVYAFPSNVGWWDYPAPHCVLGVLWSAKTLYPDMFEDVDLLAAADDFYGRFLGHAFTELGGRL